MPLTRKVCILELFTKTGATHLAPSSQPPPLVCSGFVRTRCCCSSSVKVKSETGLRTSNVAFRQIGGEMVLAKAATRSFVAFFRRKASSLSQEMQRCLAFLFIACGFSLKSEVLRQSLGLRGEDDCKGNVNLPRSVEVTSPDSKKLDLSMSVMLASRTLSLSNELNGWKPARNYFAAGGTLNLASIDGLKGRCELGYYSPD